MLQKIHARFSSLPHSSIVLVAVLLALALSALDFATGYELSFAFFYEIPIVFAAWYGARKDGVLLSFLSAAVWAVANLLAGEVYSSPFVFIWNTSTRLGFFLLTTFLLDSLKSTIERERQLSRTDYLTGVLNKRAFDEAARQILQKRPAQANPGALALVSIDLDNFKQVNDTLGHSAGDGLLKDVAQAIQKLAPPNSLVARIGGDEFVVLTPGGDLQIIERYFNEMQAALTKEIAHHTGVTLSMGVMICEQLNISIDEMLKLSDSMMYASKSKGKNTWSYQVCE